MIDFKPALERHLIQKLNNHEWLNKCSQGQVDSFPYRVDPNGKATIGDLLFQPNRTPVNIERARNTSSPRFVVNMPLAHSPSQTCQHDYRRYLEIFNAFKKQSFTAASEKSVPSQLALVLGINQIKSIDPAVNRAFKDFIQHLPRERAVPGDAYGFFWKPVWEAKKPNVYPISKAFLLLKALSSNQAEKVRKKYETGEGSLHPDIISQIPFQKIRETIKNSSSTRTMMRQMEEKFPKAPIYYTVMDADFVSLKGEKKKKGLFTCLKQMIQRHLCPSIASPGYRASDDELAIIKLGISIDMAVREAMAQTHTPYFPEPCTAFKVRNPNEPNFLRRLSFLGSGQALETRRLKESAPEYLTDGAVFENLGAVVTSTPKRMKTKKNQRLGLTLTPSQLKKKESLMAIRGISQSHAFPKQWADILYAGLNFKCSLVTNATTPMMHIFSVFDPISRMFATPGRYSTTIFDQVMKNYNQPLSEAQKALLLSARVKLEQLGMDPDMIKRIEACATASGEAIHRVLFEATNRAQPKRA